MTGGTIVIKPKNVRFDLWKATVQIDPQHDKEVAKLQKMCDRYRKQIAEEQFSNPQKYRRAQKSLQRKQPLLDAALEARARISTPTGPWDLAPLLAYACAQEHSITTLASNGERVEIDKNTLFTSDPDLIAFQVTHLREYDIPAKKAIGHARLPIDLNDDEYIGEFTQVVYDRRFQVVAVQSTKHGPSAYTIAQLFNEIARQKGEPTILLGSFSPLLDPRASEKARAARVYKKITLKCSDAFYPSSGMEEHFAGSQRFVSPELSGYTMTLTISFKERNKTKTLNQDQIRRVIDQYQALLNDPLARPQSKDDLSVAVTYLNETTDSYTTAELFAPKMGFTVPVQVKQRQIVQSEYLYELVREAYHQLDGTLMDLCAKR